MAGVRDAEGGLGTALNASIENEKGFLDTGRLLDTYPKLGECIGDYAPATSAVGYKLPRAIRSCSSINARQSMRIRYFKAISWFSNPVNTP